MKRLLLIGLLFVTVAKTKSQTKTHTGKFEDGIATYQYYENEKMERVFHGSFDYEGSLYNLKGDFLNGNKNGKWDIYATNKSFSGWGGSIKINTEISGEYKNGLLDGNWSYSNSLKLIRSNQDDKEVSTATFKNNHFIGKVTYEANWPSNYSVIGQFDSLGFMSGSWIYIKGVEKDEIRFINGVASWRLYNNITNGEMKVFCDSTRFVNEFWAAYDISSNTSTVNGKVYRPDTVLISSDKRVYNNNGPYEKKSIRNIIKIADPSMSIDRSFNPICIWQNESISVYESSLIDNPLYYYSAGSVRPIGKQIVISECNRSSDCYKRSPKGKEELKEYQFKEYINQADRRFNDNQFQSAIEYYERALEIKEDENVQEQVLRVKKFIQSQTKRIEDENKRIEIIKEIKVFEKKLLANKLSMDNPNSDLANKKHLFTAYKTASKYLLENIYDKYVDAGRIELQTISSREISLPDFEMSLTEIKKYHKEIKFIVDFQETILKLTSEETKKLEKELKKLSSPNDIIEKLN
ncbi:hypothetical protein SAMN05192553_102721 [Cyclobacterium xiamenense]|uniref:Uncharacterized protein n=1 Tax=Cyclobacterium xiamenense TaxID=1297121 RepID=A0A1H6WLJ9_9BACT|nr:hypothetical protein [Cyclobacterium xiamenense]SEJ16606.1 hypothetical protein SAMN05192553_102721 [Cyclobacterium xiamenense]